jgi:hypothetical protein
MKSQVTGVPFLRIRVVPAVIGAVAIAASPSMGATAADGDSALAGKWVSVDPADGSRQHIAISQHGDLFTLVWEDSYWSICKGRPGLMEGAGRLRPQGAQTLAIDREVLRFEPREVVIRDTATFELRGDDVLVATAGNGAFVNQQLTRMNVEPAAGAVDLRPGATAVEPQPAAIVLAATDQKTKRVVLSPQELAFEMSPTTDLRRTVTQLQEEVARLSREVAMLQDSFRPGERHL